MKLIKIQKILYSYNVITSVLLFILLLDLIDGESFTAIVAKHMKRFNHITKHFVSPSSNTNKLHFLTPSSTGVKISAVNVGSFRFVYTAPDAPEPSEDEYMDAQNLTFNYVAKYLCLALEIQFAGFGGSFSFSYDANSNPDPKIYMQWTDFLVESSDEITLSPTDIFEIITLIIVHNQTYLDLITDLTKSPFKMTTDVEIDNYSVGTLHPTRAPYPTPSPVPTSPAVYVPLGEIKISYTSPGASEPSDEHFTNAMAFTYYYLNDVFVNTFESDYVHNFLSASEIDYIYIDPTSKPNIITTYLNVNATFTEYSKIVPTATKIARVLIESINATYIDLFNNYNGGLFGTVVDATMQVRWYDGGTYPNESSWSLKTK